VKDALLLLRLHRMIPVCDVSGKTCEVYEFVCLHPISLSLSLFLSSFTTSFLSIFLLSVFGMNGSVFCVCCVVQVSRTHSFHRQEKGREKEETDCCKTFLSHPDKRREERGCRHTQT